MISVPQLRAAKGLLGWDAVKLAEVTGIARATLSNIENDNVQPRADTMDKIFRALTAEGVEFLADNGVQLKNDRLVTLHGDNSFSRVLDDVITTLRYAKQPEALFACVNDALSPPIVIENYRRLRQLKIQMRSLVQDGDTKLMGRPEEYRYLPKPYFHNSTTVIYGDKFATMILDPDSRADVGAIIIRNPHVAAAQRNLFNLIWSGAERPTKTTSKVRYEE